MFAPRGWIGALLTPLGIKVAYTPLGILVALIFVGLPFVVRTLEPVIMDLPLASEEAAATLGATRAQIVRRVVLPALIPALLAGFGAALARGVGEYGSVIFIAGNMPMISEIAPLLIVIRWNSSTTPAPPRWVWSCYWSRSPSAAAQSVGAAHPFAHIESTGHAGKPSECGWY